MIDCHVHAYPGPGEHLDRALDALSPDVGFILRDALEDLRASAAALASRLPSGGVLGVPMGIETLAATGRRLPAPVKDALERLAALGVLPQVLLSGDVDQLLGSMDRAGVERAVVIAAPPLAGNAWLLKQAWPRARSRLVPVAALPSVPDDAAEGVWADAFADLAKAGARGFKIHPRRDALAPQAAAYRALFAVAQENRLFVVLHTGGNASPGAFEPLISEFPSVRVCLAHMNRERPEEAWDLMKRHEQVFADTSWQPADQVQAALKQVGARRILLGSDWPLLNGRLQTNAIDILKRAATPAELERVGTYNPLVFLGEA